MSPSDLVRASLKQRCADIADVVFEDFTTRMEEEYFQHFTLDEIASHLYLAVRLDSEHPCQVAIHPRPRGRFDIVIVAYDYFSEFATISGLLSAFGLDIRTGNIYTSGETAVRPSPPRLSSDQFPFRRRRPLGLSQKKIIIDHFDVHPLTPQTFTSIQQAAFIEQLTRMVILLDNNRIQDVRNHVNRLLVERLGRSSSAHSHTLAPITITFDNAASATDTVIDIRSADTPAFLYAFANALAMRGIYVQKASFANVGQQVHDRFFVRARHGEKIESPEDQEELRLTATLIKQFTHVLPSAPDPSKALRAFDQFLDHLLQDAQRGKALSFLRKKDMLSLLAKLLGASDFLWEDFLRTQYDNLLPMLSDYRKVPLLRSRASMAQELRRRLAAVRGDERRRRELNHFKDQEMFRIDMKHLLDTTTTLPTFSQALTDLAEVIVGQAVHDSLSLVMKAHGAPALATGKVCPFAVFGMGKFGGRELGYASDIELLFVFGGEGSTSGRRSLGNTEFYELVVQDLLQRIEAKQEGIFHVDIRLRPHGAKGLLANTLQEIRTYYSSTGLSAPFERQALIKLRGVAGDRALRRHVEQHRDIYVYGGAPWDLTVALDIRLQQIRELTDPSHINVKYSSGGLIDIEYAVQYLQILHGHRMTELRTPNTLEALRILGEMAIMAKADVVALQDAYLFLRVLIDGLRLVRGNAKDLVLPDDNTEEFVFLARRVGYSSEQWQQGARQLNKDLASHMATVKTFYNRQFRG